MFEFLSFWFLFLFTNLIIMCFDGNFQATKLDALLLVLDTRVLGLLWKSRQMTRNFTEKRVSRASGSKGPWIFAKIPSNALMFFALTRNFTENLLVVLLVTRVLEFLRKSRLMPRCLLLLLAISRKNPLIVLLVTRVLGFLRKSCQMPQCLL